MGGRLSLPLSVATRAVLSRVEEITQGRSLDCYLTGGFVRDAAIGRHSGDVDLVVSGDALAVADEVARATGGKYILLDEPHRIARVVIPGEEHLHLDFAGMHGDIEEDLLLRDFTINALAVDLRQIGQATISVVDPSGGERDLEDGVVRAVSEKALQEDPLRLLRAVRLVAELDFSLDAETRAMIGRNHVLLGGVSAERVRDELCRMLAVPGAAEWLRLLDQVGLLTVVVPELAATKGVGQPKEHVWDVFEHSLQTVAAVELVLQIDSAAVWDREVASVVPWSAEMKDYFEEEVSVGRSRGTMLKLAGLLHDVAKPQTKFVDSDGRTRFFGHAKEGAVIATQVLKRLRFSTREVGMVSSMVRHHLRPTQLGGVTPSRRAIYRYFKDTGEAAIDTLFLSLADHLATRGPLVDLDAFREHADSVAYVLEEPAREQSVVTPPKLVNGNDLMAIYGIAPGPRLGEILEAVREAQAAGEVMTREDALSFVERYLGRATVDIRQDARRKNE